MVEEESNPLTTYRDDLTRGLDPHVDQLVERFTSLSLLSEDEVTNLQTQNKRLSQVNCLLDIVTNKRVQHNDKKCFNELINFMRSSQDVHLSGLVEKMRIRQDDHDDIEPCAPTEQSDVGHGMYVCM